MRKIVIFLLGYIFLPPVFSQKEQVNFSRYSKMMNERFKPGDKGYKQWKRKEYFLKPRLYNCDHVNNMTVRNLQAYEELQKNNTDSRSTHGAWSFQGPNQSNVGLGRLNCIEIDPTNPNIIYVGASSGGVWKSTNGGTSWQNISTHLPLLAVADIVVNPGNSNEIFLLTGEGDALPSGTLINGSYSSIGVLISQDGGVNWSPTATSFNPTDSIIPHKLLVDPTDPNIQFIASATGILRTNDKWQTFTNELNVLTYDIEFNPSDHEEMYACSNNTFYKSFDNGLNWISINDNNFNLFDNNDRLEIAIAPSNSNEIYLLGGDWNVGLKAVLRSSVKGSNGTWFPTTNSFTGMGAIANYCIALAVSPTDFTKVYGGMQWICKSTNSGANWSSIVQSTVHADVHDIAIQGSNLYVACDGGLYKSTDEGTSWVDLSLGLEITEIYDISGTPQNTSLYFMGTQDNGTKRKNSSSGNFADVLGGDGMISHIHPNNSNLIYASQQNGSLWWSPNGGTSFFQYSTGGGGWVTPYQLDNSNLNNMLVGYKDLFRVNLTDFSWTSLQFPPQNNFLDCIAQGVNGASRIYASYKDSIYRSNIGSGIWTYIGDGLPNLFITDIEVNPNDSSDLFVTLSSYTANQKVFRSSDGGNTWQNISNNLPNIPINCITYHNNGLNNDALYIGTDIGVFYRNNDLGEWIYFSNFLPNVRVADLFINYGDNTIAAGTYGRGLWKSSLYDGCQEDLVLTSNGGGGTRYFSANNSIYSIASQLSDMHNNINYTAGNNIVLAPGFEIKGLARFNGKIDDCAPPYSGLTNYQNDTEMGKLILTENQKKLLYSIR